MCGIFGYVGKKNAQDIILAGLAKLEYRGYDSAGISIYNNNAITTVKFKGKLQTLTDYVKKSPVVGSIGIGHTRWATHGIPSDINSHPHMSNDNKFSIVHNGIIENYQEIKDVLIKKGYKFKSDTDTEVIVNLIQDNYKGNLLQAVQTTVTKLIGAYAIVVISANHANELVAVRAKSPLIIGKLQNEYFLASDIQAIYPHTKEAYYLENNDIAHIQAGKLNFYDFKLKPVTRPAKIVDWVIDTAEKGDYDFFMLKEIHEQPNVMNNIFLKYVNDDNTIKMPLVAELINGIKNIHMVSCGTAYFAGLAAGRIISRITKFNMYEDIASEFTGEDKHINKHCLMLVLSQSGETADTLNAMRIAKSKGAKILAIVNVQESTIARESDYVFYTNAGSEIAVASTKAFSSQILVATLLALEIAKLQKTITPTFYQEQIIELRKLSYNVTEVLNSENNIEKIAKNIHKRQSIFYIGRGLDYATCLEGSLKMKEISYMHSEAIPSGELKHGSIALLNEGFPVVVIITDKNMVAKVTSNLKEVKSRGAYTIVVTLKSIKNLESISDEVIYVPESNSNLGINSVIPLQLLAYHVALMRGNDIDKPRNLAKSVTVE
ncbi:glutamine--fructose-6-phosphate transaminase [Candidatus Hepatincola sp. Pdp]